VEIILNICDCQELDYDLKKGKKIFSIIIYYRNI
jgi:hypothetical protein